MNVGRRVDRRDDHRIYPAVVVVKREVRRAPIDDVEDARALVFRPAGADRQVEDIKPGRGPGCLAERSIALGARMAVALKTPRLPIPALSRQRRRGGAATGRVVGNDRNGICRPRAVRWAVWLERGLGDTV